MRILMLGNSYTCAHDLPERLARSLDAEVVVHTRGGARLAEHLNPRTKLGMRTQAALSAGGWDFVILQEMSNAPATTPDRYLHSVASLCAQARAAGAMPILFGTWAYAPTSAQLERLGITGEELYRRLHAAFAQAAHDNDACLADVGTAFHEAADPTTLYASDGSHPSPAGTALACRILAATINAAGHAPTA